MTDLCGPIPMSSAIMSSALLSMAEDVARAQGRFHPGRPAFSALSRAHEALVQAAREVEYARQTYAPLRDAAEGR